MITRENIEWTLPDGCIIDIPINHHTNLPLIHNSVCSLEDIKTHHDLFGTAMTSIETVDMTPVEVNKAEVKTHERDCVRQCCQCVAGESNQNLSGPQKELLHWHQKLCMNMQDLQELMRPQNIQ